MIRRLLLVLLLVAATCYDATSGVAQPKILLRQQYRNLKIYLLQETRDTGSKQDYASKQEFMTLGEALKRNLATAHDTHETTLSFDNLSDAPILIQSGDMLKGGQQDRVLAFDLILPAHSQNRSLEAYCVEHGRSTRRGPEPLHTFSTASHVAPSVRLRLQTKHRLLTEGKSANGDGVTAPSGVDPNMLAIVTEQLRFSNSEDPIQQAIWRATAELKDSLSHIDTNTSPTLSPSSLMLTSESEATEQLIAPYLKALLKINTEGATGIAIAIGGVVVSADEYCSTALFQQNVERIVRAAAIEAVAHSKSSDKTTSEASVMQFLGDTEGLPQTSKQLDEWTTIVASETSATSFFETRENSGAWVHRSFLAR